MKFGLFFLLEKFAGMSDSEVYHNSLEQVAAAEELGYDYIWPAEHRFTPYGICPDTMVFSAAAAAITKRIRIGTAVVVLPFHNPIRLAEQVAMLDVISNGRYEFGVGRGYQAAEYRGFGISMDESRARFEEVLDICIGLWTQDHFSFEGKHFHIDDVTIEPKPVQKPHPPVRITVMRTPASFKYAAERGYTVIAGNPYQADPEFREAFFNYQTVLKEMGKEELSKDFWALTGTFVHEDPELAKKIPEESWLSYRQSGIDYAKVKPADGSLSSDYAAYADRDERMRDRPTNLFDMPSSLVGNPERVIEKLKKLEDEGMGNFILWMNRGGGIPQKEVLRSMELFAKKVMPAFKEAKVAT